MTDKARVEALSEARAAVRAYSRNPTTTNAEKVEAAWRVIRTMDAVSAWRTDRDAKSRDPGTEPAAA